MISFSIFMASRIISTCPFLTALPLDTLTDRMVPGMGAQTFSPPAGAAAGAAAGGSHGSGGSGSRAGDLLQLYLIYGAVYVDSVLLHGAFLLTLS